jgi:hypothetical protein
LRRELRNHRTATEPFQPPSVLHQPDNRCVRIENALAFATTTHLPTRDLGRPATTAPYETQPAPRNLVHLAREILKSTGREGKVSVRAQNDPDMSAVEEQGGALAESPSSRFTAVNEKEQPTIVVSMNGVNGNAASRRSPPDERAKAQAMMPPPVHEKLSISTTTSPTQREEWISPPSGERSQYQPSASYSDSDSPHKRKRSADADQNSPPSANSYHSHGLPSSARQAQAATSTEPDGPREESPRGQPQPDPRDPYNADPQYRPYLSSAEESRESAQGSDLWHSRHYPQQTHISSDEHLGEVLQRASQSMDAQQRREYEQTSPGEDDRSGASAYAAYGAERRDISTQADPKKRKRNFSNRTKTGCMTCRRRKKKCDEARPECELACPEPYNDRRAERVIILALVWN